jgi:hypothetical protein
MIFRVFNKTSKSYLCFLDTLYWACSNPIIKDLYNDQTRDQPYNLSLIINGLDMQIEVEVDGKHFRSSSITGKQRIIWIGYNIRKAGTVKAFIQFNEK